MKNFKALFLALVMLVSFTSCYTLEHQVGQGANSGNSVEKRQWYVLWGLVPINEVDSKAMADGATDYTIETKHTFVDVVIGVFTGFVTVYPKTVKVTK